MNTRINYMYRDEYNFKMHHEEVLNGEITQQQLMTIVDCLYERAYFIPHQVGLPEFGPDDTAEGDNRWFELHPEQDFSTTNSEPTIDMTVDELVERFRMAKDHWEEEDDGEYFIAVEPVILYSGKTIVGMLSAKIVSVYGEDAMQQKVSSLIKEGYKEDGIHVFFAKDEIK